MLELGIVLSIVVVLVAAIVTLRADKFGFVSNLEGQKGALQKEIQLLEKKWQEEAEEHKEFDKWKRDKASVEAEIKSQEEDEQLLKLRVAKLHEELDGKLHELAEKEAELTAKREQLDKITAELEAAERRQREAEARLLGIESRIAEAAARLEVVQRELKEAEKKRKEEESLGPGATVAGAAGGHRLLDASAFAELEEPYVKDGPSEEREFQFRADEFVGRLERDGFHFSERLVKAFHTSLMVQDISSLTVMAGVSGTGKTTLPKQYAKYMGMHFLLLPVEPRWDSPQDLFGFMNYLEGRYVATELGRALRQFDIADGEMKDRMLLVLLDEMNLARVEYYFSEFLSRLEMKRTVNWAGVERDDDDYRLTSMEIFSGQKASEEPKVDAIEPIRLLAGPNVLFAGTMNEDETTNTLSDKVNDRSNVIRFGMPETLESRGQAESASEQDAEGEAWLAYKSWGAAVEKTQSGSDEAKAKDVREYVEELNKKFEEAGKHFGHRPYEATLRYIQSHPDGRLDGIARNLPLADQVAMRFLPRLNGLDLEEHKGMLGSVEDSVNKLEDQAVKDAFEKAMDQRKWGSVFQWPGINWDQEPDG